MPFARAPPPDPMGWIPCEKCGSLMPKNGVCSYMWCDSNCEHDSVPVQR